MGVTSCPDESCASDEVRQDGWRMGCSPEGQTSYDVQMAKKHRCSNGEEISVSNHDTEEDNRSFKAKTFMLRPARSFLVVFSKKG